MQSNLISSVISSAPSLNDLFSKNVTRNVEQSDDTFMKMLNDKLQAKTTSDSVSSKFMKKVDNAQRTSVTDSSEIGLSSQSDSVNETKRRTSSESSKADKAEDEDSESIAKKRKKIEETLSTLESLVALLEALLAKLEVYATESESAENSMALEAMAEGDQDINLVELLKALAEGNTEKLKEIVESLENGDQTGEIQDLLSNIRELIAKLEGSEEAGNLFNISIEDLTEGASREELIAQLREQANEMLSKLRTQISELRQSLEQLSEQTSTEEVPVLAADSQNVGQSLEENPMDTSKDVKEAEKGQKSSAEADSSINLYPNPNQAENIANLEDAVQPQAMIVDNTRPTPIQVDSSVKNAVPLTQKPMPEAITNQVMMKVKLMAGENKQEMEMQLKPENLGKLSLKIIHERGEVLAKITAENEQVKGILESNMQLLRDALEKNGFTVQSLSVSVGHGNSENTGSHDAQGEKSSGTRSNHRGQVTANAPETLYAPSREYLDQSSQINLTA